MGVSAMGVSSVAHDIFPSSTMLFVALFIAPVAASVAALCRCDAGTDRRLPGWNRGWS